MNKNTPEKFPIEIPASRTAFLSFENAQGIYVDSDRRSNRSYVMIDQDVEYPQPSNKQLDRLLLPHKEDSVGIRHLLLPENFITMPQILNDAIGDNKSDRSIEVARTAFAKVGRGLARVAMLDHEIPEDLSYKNIVFSRNGYGFRLLPPIKFVPFQIQFSEQAKSHVVKSLSGSLEEGASNTTQVGNVYAAFGPFIKNYDWQG